MKRSLKWKRRELRDLDVTIAQHESSLGWGQDQQEGAMGSDDDHSDSGPDVIVEEEMTSTSATGDATSASTTHAESVVPPPGEEPTPTMEVDEPIDQPPPDSPVSLMEDDLLTGDDAVGVEGEMSKLKVSSPRHQEDGDGDTSK